MTTPILIRKSVLSAPTKHLPLSTNTKRGGVNNPLFRLISSRFAATLFLALFFSVFSLRSQTATTPVVFDFEDPTECTQWDLNVGNDAIVSQLQNRWVVSPSEHFTGERSLIISNNYTAARPTATYSNTGSNIAVVARRVITLPAGSYDLSFAWKCVGESGADGFYVLWESESYAISSSMAGVRPELVRRSLDFPGKAKPFCVKSSWQTETIKIMSNGTPMQLAFMWVNNGAKAQPVSACIDMIQISEQEACTEVTDVKASSTLYANRTSVTWKGVAEEYELMYRRLGDTSAPEVIEDITTHSYTVEIDEPGLYDFFVRGICGEDTSVWVPYRNHLIYSPGCIDYANLYSDNVVCRHNVRPADGDWDERGDNDFPDINSSDWVVGVVDNGPDSMSSRHTVHTIPEIDPRTVGTPGSNGLPTIPDGEVVSVRLGNWNMGAEGESITYTITADSIYRIILLKYAVVFEDPNHDTQNQPFFSLKITNERGEPISGICGKEDFRPSTNLGADDGWHEKVTGSGNEKQTLRWKDWTSVGVIIPEEEFGRKLKIELRTYDCEEGGHYGYAYFTLSCAPATITGIACGEQKEQNIKAPDGFTYEWYVDDPNDPTDQNNVLFTTQGITVDGKDTRTYYCDCSFVTTNKDKLDKCTFTLSANLTPRFPQPAALFQHQPSFCKNNDVKFNNLSAVVTDEGIPMGGERCDSYEWEIIGVDADSIFIPIDKNPVVSFPVEGGTYQVRLTAGMSEGNCEESKVYDLVVPPLCPKFTWVDTVACSKYPFRWNGRTYDESSLDTVSYKMSGGCDSTIYLNLTMVDEVTDTIIDTICQGAVYKFFDQECTVSDDYVQLKKAAKPSLCDSTVLLRLTVIDTLSVSVQPLPEICEGDSLFSLSYIVNQGEFISLTVDFDTAAGRVGFVDTIYNTDVPTELSFRLPPDARPDWYAVDLKFATEHCDTLVRHIPFCVLYSTDVLQQKWNDVIAVLSSEYNGGYNFTAFQWYEDGVLLQEQTKPYFYLGENRWFAYADTVQYSAGLMRSGENYYIRTCSVTPEPHADIQPYVSVSSARAGQVVALALAPAIENGNLTVRWYSASGQLVAESYTTLANPTVVTPPTPGIYLLELRTETSRHTTKVQVQ